MSDNSVELICESLGALDILVEYGSGSSTRYFLRRLIESGRECQFVSVERSDTWFRKVADEIQRDLKAENTSEPAMELHPWGMDRVQRYTESQSQSSLDVPPELQRIKRLQRALAGNPLRKLALAVMKSRRPHDGYFSVVVEGRVRFLYVLTSEPMKDQYGESPFKMDYINAGLDTVRELLRDNPGLSAGFIVDGGPRGDVVHAILDLEDQHPGFRPTIFLLEAHRVFYQSAVARRESGTYLRGSNRMLSGDLAYPKAPRDRGKNEFWYGHADATVDELLARELWCYRGEGSKRAPATRASQPS